MRTSEGQRFWIVKGRNDQMDWRIIDPPGRVTSWRSRRPPKAMQVGDGVFFWLATPHCCVIGLGEVEALPVLVGGEDGYRYKLKSLSGRLENTIGKPELLRDEIVGPASFLKIGMASGIVRLEEIQAKRMAELLVERNGASAFAPWWSLR